MPRIQLPFSRIAALMLAVCFTVGTVGVTFVSCNLKEQTPAQEMDCHKTEKAAADALCNLDFSCAKCFSSPIEPQRLALLAPPASGKIAFRPDALIDHTPAAFERPPKRV